jgi:hypothetical protein
MVDTTQTLANRTSEPTAILSAARSTAPPASADKDSITWWWDAPH